MLEANIQEGGCVSCTIRGHSRGVDALVTQQAMGRNQWNGLEFNMESGRKPAKMRSGEKLPHPQLLASSI